MTAVIPALLEGSSTFVQVKLTTRLC